MAMVEQDKVIETTRYDGVILEEYKGTYAIKAVVKGGGETMVWYHLWAFPSKWKNGEKIPGDKSFPVSVKLGDKEKAIETLKAMLKELA